MKDIKRFPLAALATAALALGGLASVDGVAYADGEVGGVIKVTQDFETSDASVTGEFEYCLEAKTPNAPMPNGTVGDKYCFTMTGTTEYDIQLRAGASTPAESEYVLRFATQLAEGYELTSTDAYEYKVYAHPGDGYIVLAFDPEDISRSKEEDPTFSLVYKLNPTTPPATTTPPPTTPPVKPPTSTLVQTGATVTLGAMIVLLLAGGLLLSRRRETA